MTLRSHLDFFNFPIPEEILEFDSYPKITNYVATVSLDVQFNLNSLVLYLSSTDRKPSRFAAITIKIHPTTCLLFSSGNMVITGGRTEMGAKLAAHTYRLILEKIPQPVFDIKTGKFIITTLEDYTSFNNFTVVNIVGSGKLFQNNQVNLGSLSKDNIGLIGWDAQIFPGLRFNIERNADECPIEAEELMAHIFQGANDVIMGARVKEDIYKAHMFLKRTVLRYLSNPIQEITAAGNEDIDNVPMESNQSGDNDNGEELEAENRSHSSNTDEDVVGGGAKLHNIITNAGNISPPMKPSRRGATRKVTTNKQAELAREHTKMLQNALKSQKNIYIGGAGIGKKPKRKAPTKIQNPRSLNNNNNVDRDDDILDEMTPANLFTQTSAIAIARELPPAFRQFIQEDTNLMTEFMEEFNDF
jgi:transcription initiation factor TFIID TATA-box-binding protein